MNTKDLFFRDIATCSQCLLKQFVRTDTMCRRCFRPLNITYYEFPLPRSGQIGTSLQSHAARRIIGHMIRELRQKQGMTQSALANRLATHRSHLSRIERGRLMPRGDLLLRCIASLGADKIILRIRQQAEKRSAAPNEPSP